MALRSLLSWFSAVLILSLFCHSVSAQSSTRSRSSGASGGATLPPEVVNRIKAQRAKSSGASTAATDENTDPVSSGNWQARTQNEDLSTASSTDEDSTEETLEQRLQRKSAEVAARKKSASGTTAPPALKKTPEVDAPQSSASEVSRIQQVSGTVEQAVLAEPAKTETEATESSGVPFLDLEPETRSGGSARSPEHSPEVTLATSPANVIVRAAVWLVITFCLLILAVLGVRRWQRARGLLPATGSQSRVVETLSVGPGRIVSLIEIAGLRALVASDAGGIKTLVLAPVNFPDELQKEMQEPIPEEPPVHGQTIAEF
ncbi:MAG: flagellar biosynthetic protein FliO [Planctomycetaceae bacterium]